jgi:hypothetical protein
MSNIMQQDRTTVTELSSAPKEFPAAMNSAAIIVSDQSVRQEIADLIRDIQVAWGEMNAKSAWSRIAQATAMTVGQIKRLAYCEMTVPAHTAETIRRLAEMELAASARRFEQRSALLHARRAALQNRISHGNSSQALCVETEGYVGPDRRVGSQRG